MLCYVWKKKKKKKTVDNKKFWTVDSLDEVLLWIMDS